MDQDNLKSLLDSRADFYNRPFFIPEDPISVPHQFTGKEDIEIAGFLSATIAWGNRKSILSSANKLIALMEHSPYEFLLHAPPADFKRFLPFVHRTFNGDDCLFFLATLKEIFHLYGSLEPLFSDFNEHGAEHAITQFRKTFLRWPHLQRTEKHLANPSGGSAAKRINMFLRWMVRKDDRGVDFGIWHTIDPSRLVCPLDIHTGTVARSLGLVTRRQNDWMAAVELTNRLKEFDPSDPVRYDFALFGMGLEKG